MSVDVKTPTRTQFEHPEFPCGDIRPSVGDAFPLHGASSLVTSAAGSSATSSHSRLAESVRKSLSQDSSEGDQSFNRGRRGSVSRKRRYNDKGGPGNAAMPFNPKRRTGTRRNSEKEKIVLPTKFLLGGSITDPLNLNSLCDEEVNRALNERTPQSSPLPIPTHKQEVKVLIPPNINDPLNLNSGEDIELSLLSPKSSNKKKKNKHKKRKSADGGVPGPAGDEGSQSRQLSTEEQIPDVTRPLTLEIGDTTNDVPPSAPGTSSGSLDEKVSRIIDKIVSPVIPQAPPKAKKRKRNSSECRPEPIPASRSQSREDSDKSGKSDKPAHRPRYRRQSSSQSTTQTTQPKPKPKRDDKFIYGNYNRYYGYRNPDASEDARLKCLRPEWFDGKDVLDIGCNVGHLTLTIAKKLHPNKIVGIDIDHKLISAAKKNIRFYLTNESTDTSKFPSSLALIYGPIAAQPAPVDNKTQQPKLDFPNNIMFMQGNYVLERDDLVELQQEEYDLILCFSITKWLHLNFGDGGLKRAFRRIYRQLRPGGRLVLEPQSWASYKRKKKLSETILKNYESIQFKPDQFTEYLLSSAVGFSKCEKLQIPFDNKSKGFQRPVFVYTKPDTAMATPYGLESRGVTPFASSTPGGRTPGGQALTPFSTYTNATNTPLSEMASPRGFTPKFEVGSTGVTPCSTCENTPNYVYQSTLSAGATPTKTEGSSLEATPQREADYVDREVTPPASDAARGDAEPDSSAIEVPMENFPTESGQSSPAEEAIIVNHVQSPSKQDMP